MSKLVKGITSIFKSPKAPEASTAAVESLDEGSRKATQSRSALFETSGGVAGEEIGADGVKQRNTLLGN
tara:strand:- start:15208 stop:15414 length:207 start_codon:yes stop_codon:yes gene_type:complete